MKFPSKRKVVARLSPEELEQVVKADEIIEKLKYLYTLAVDGQRVIWWRLKKKYSLPDNIDFNKETGEIFERRDA